MLRHLLTKFASYKVPPVMVSTHGSVVPRAMFHYSEQIYHRSQVSKTSLCVPKMGDWVSQSVTVTHIELYSDCVWTSKNLGEQIYFAVPPSRSIIWKKYFINLTCWQYGCDSMLRVGRGQGWLPNATLSGKLRGRGGGGDTIQIFPPRKVRGVGEESRKGWRLGIFSNFETFLTPSASTPLPCQLSQLPSQRSMEWIENIRKLKLQPLRLARLLLLLHTLYHLDGLSGTSHIAQSLVVGPIGCRPYSCFFLLLLLLLLLILLLLFFFFPFPH